MAWGILRVKLLMQRDSGIKSERLKFKYAYKVLSYLALLLTVHFS